MSDDKRAELTERNLGSIAQKLKASNDIVTFDRSDGSCTIEREEIITPPPKKQITSTSSNSMGASIEKETWITSQTTESVRTSMYIRTGSRSEALISALVGAQGQLKSLFTFLQLTIMIESNCSISFPSSFQQQLKAIRFINADLIPTFYLACKYGRFDYIDKLKFATLAPIAVSILLALAYVAVRRLSKPKTANELKMKRYVVPSRLHTVITASEVEKLKATFALCDTNGTPSIHFDFQILMMFLFL
jgi:hypothetical protein